MSDFKDIYPEIARIFSPGYAIDKPHLPLLEALNHPLFKKITQFTDQTIFIINHSTFRYEFVSENVKQVFGFSANDIMEGTMNIIATHHNQDDLRYAQEVVYPSFYRCLDRVPESEKLNIKSEYTYRVTHALGHSLQIHQQNIILTMEQNKAILGLCICSDISRYKKDNQVLYRNVLVLNTGERQELESNVANNLFTPKESATLQLTAEGLSEKEIANRLSVSINTIKSHRRSMIKKTGVKNTSELMRFAMANLLIV